jgi:hypothetical protein
MISMLTLYINCDKQYQFWDLMWSFNPFAELGSKSRTVYYSVTTTCTLDATEVQVHQPWRLSLRPCSEPKAVYINSQATTE